MIVKYMQTPDMNITYNSQMCGNVLLCGKNKNLAGLHTNPNFLCSAGVCDYGDGYVVQSETVCNENCTNLQVFYQKCNSVAI